MLVCHGICDIIVVERTENNSWKLDQAEHSAQAYLAGCFESEDDNWDDVKPVRSIVDSVRARGEGTWDERSGRDNPGGNERCCNDDKTGLDGEG